MAKQYAQHCVSLSDMKTLSPLPTVTEFDQKTPQSQTTDNPMVPRERDTESRQQEHKVKQSTLSSLSRCLQTQKRNGLLNFKRINTSFVYSLLHIQKKKIPALLCKTGKPKLHQSLCTCIAVDQGNSFPRQKSYSGPQVEFNTY